MFVFVFVRVLSARVTATPLVSLVSRVRHLGAVVRQEGVGAQKRAGFGQARRRAHQDHRAQPLERASKRRGARVVRGGVCGRARGALDDRGHERVRRGVREWGSRGRWTRSAARLRLHLLRQSVELRGGHHRKVVLKLGPRGGGQLRRGGLARHRQVALALGLLQRGDQHRGHRGASRLDVRHRAPTRHDLVTRCRLALTKSSSAL